jgi:hypothetical protein
MPLIASPAWGVFCHFFAIDQPFARLARDVDLRKDVDPVDVSFVETWLNFGFMQDRQNATPNLNLAA